MLASVLLPAAYYSYHLRDPTPSQLLVAICIGLFSSVVFWWILDAVSVLRFRSEWVSKSVYGAAIVSILGTSAGVYKDALSGNKYPFEGAWHLSISDPKDDSQQADLSLALAYSEQAETYWGYSEYRPPTNKQHEDIVWVRVDDFDPKEGTITLSWVDKDGNKSSMTTRVIPKHNSKLFENDTKDSKLVRLSRPD
jgi:hypothetical protein